MNAPERFETFLLEEGQEKLAVEKDEKIPNAATFKIQKEDHTVGNLVRMQLLRDRKVVFAGYKVPHPLENFVLIKIQTQPSTTPVKAFKTSIDSLLKEVNTLEQDFERVMSNVTR